MPVLALTLETASDAQASRMPSLVSVSVAKKKKRSAAAVRSKQGRKKKSIVFFEIHRELAKKYKGS